MNKVQILIISILINIALSINFQLIKKNIRIVQDQMYLTTISVKRVNAELIPINISLQSTIINTLPSYNSYFDYFYYLNREDVSCYSQSVQNQSYLYPCPFIENKYSLLRTNYVQSQKINQSVDENKNIEYSFIVDNTPFPYPLGAYGYSPINVDIGLQVTMQVSSSYQALGTRLIYINISVIIIFVSIIGALVFKTRKLKTRMSNSSLSETRRSQIEAALSMSKRFQDSSSEEQEQELDEEDNIKGLNQKLLREETIEYQDQLLQRKSQQVERKAKSQFEKKDYFYEHSATKYDNS